MASLKDINEEIIKGNEDLERLNKNFEAWIKSQQPTGDDLEAKREAKKALASPGFKQVFRKDTQKKTGGGEGLFGTGLGVKGILGLTALIGPLLAAMFKDEILKMIPKIPGFTNPDTGQPEFPEDITTTPFSGKVIQIALKGLKTNLKNMTLKYNKLLSENRALKIQVRTLLSPGTGTPGTGKPTIPNRTLPFQRTSMGDGGRNMRGTNSAGVPKGGFKPNIPVGSSPRDFDARTAKQYGSRFGVKTFGGGFQFISKEDFRNLKATVGTGGTQSPRGSVNKQQNGVSKGVLRALFSSAAKILPDFNEKETFRSLVQANLFPQQKMFPNVYAYGTALFEFGKQYTPGPLRTVMRWLFNPILMRTVFTGAVLAEIALILFNKKLVLSNALTGEEMLVDARYTLAEQIVGVGTLISGFAGGALGAALGASVGAVAGPLGIFAGGVIGGYLGFKSGYFIAKFLFDVAFKKKNAMMRYKKEIEVFQRAKKGVQQNQAMMAMNSGGMKDSTLGQLVPGDVMMGTSNISSLSEAKAARIAQSAGSYATGMNRYKAAAISGGVSSMLSNDSKVKKTAKAGSTFTGLLNYLFAPAFAEAATMDGFNVPPVNSPIVGMSPAQLMNGPEAGRGNVSSFIDAKSTNMTAVTNVNGGNGLKTIDTNPIEWMGYGPPNLQHYY